MESKKNYSFHNGSGEKGIPEERQASKHTCVSDFQSLNPVSENQIFFSNDLSLK